MMQKIFCSLLLIFSFSAQADFASSINYIKERIEDTKCQIRYYGPYVLASTVGVTSFAGGKTMGASMLAALGIYATHAAYVGYQEISAIEKKYCLTTKAVDYWNNFYPEEKFLFCRWRQLDDRYGDGYYWPTAWLCHEERMLVRTAFIRDVHAQRIEIIHETKKIKSPKPSQVMTALNAELFDLEQDKKRLQAYTTIYRTVDQPEAFHPDVTWKRMLWPNFNRASKLYIEIVQMMKRLEVIRDIVAQIRSEVSEDYWPRV
jgi:hypothetical protein